MTAAKKNLVKKLPIVKSFSRKGNLSEIKDNFGTIVVDECHHIPAKTFREVVSQF